MKTYEVGENIFLMLYDTHIYSYLFLLTQETHTT